MSNVKSILLVVLFLGITTSFALAQQALVPSDYNVSRQTWAVLPQAPSALSLVDGCLYVYSSGIMLQAYRKGTDIAALCPDTSLAVTHPQADYFVRHPLTGELYFTRLTSSGQSELFVCQCDEKKGKHKVRRVKLNNVSVVHPTFSADGRIMVFSSNDKKRNYGGYDLWYVISNNGRWERPHNMGSGINNKGDEVSPFVFGDFLLFASNGQDGSLNQFDMYATRLVSRNIVGDTASTIQVGRQKVQQLPFPLNSNVYDDCDLVVDQQNECMYWISNRDANDGCWLLSTDDRLYSTMLWGRVSDRNDNYMAGVNVQLKQSGKTILSTVTDKDGFYSLFIHPERDYQLSISRDGLFTRSVLVNIPDSDGDYLISEMQQNIIMDSLPLDWELVYVDLFRQGTDVRLSHRGEDLLQPVVDFLNDNPRLHAMFTLRCSALDDNGFNKLLTAQRLGSIQNYLTQRVTHPSRLVFTNGNAEFDGNFSIDDLSRLTVVISKGEGR